MAAVKANALHIRRVMSSDEGVYHCKAENAVGSVSGSVSLIVHALSLISYSISRSGGYFLGAIWIYFSPSS